MPRTIEIALPPERTAAVLAELRGAEGVVGIALQHGASLVPPGDLMTLRTTTEGLEAAQRVLLRHGIGREAGVVATSEPRSLLAPAHEARLDGEGNEGSWEEMATLLRRETNTGANYLAGMACAGAIAAAGLWADMLHVVIGAMVIAPGFEPIIRMPFGLLHHRREGALAGLVSTLAGYAVLAAAAGLALLLLAVLAPSAQPLGERFWVGYWSKVEAGSVLVALVAGASGATVISTQHSVLTVGVMVALALIPSMAIAGMGVATGDLALAGRGLLRWASEVACVLLAGGGVFLAKRLLRHRGVS